MRYHDNYWLTLRQMQFCNTDISNEASTDWCYHKGNVIYIVAIFNPSLNLNINKHNIYMTLNLQLQCNTRVVYNICHDYLSQLLLALFHWSIKCLLIGHLITVSNCPYNPVTT